MPAWAAFGALTVGLVATLLLLSIASARAVEPVDLPSRSTALERSDRTPGTVEGFDSGAVTPADRRLPRFESPSAHAGSVDGGRPNSGMTTGALLANVALTQGFFGVVLVAGVLYFSIPPAALGVGESLASTTFLLVGVAAGVVLWLGNELAAGVADAAGVGYDEAVRSMLTPEGAPGWLLLLGVILPTIALVEELLFRGAAIGALAVGFGVSEPLLVVASAIAFGAAHGAQGRIGAVVATALGLVLGGAFVLTGSLLVVVVAHYVVNALEFVVHEGLDVGRPLAFVEARSPDR